MNANDRSSRWGVVLVVLAAARLAAQDAPSEESTEFFRRNCASCHTIGGGRLTGPDLKDVEKRRDRAQLVPFILDPKAAIDSGDPYVRRLVEEARGAIMQQVPGLDRARIARLLDLIAWESKQPKSRFAGTLVSDRPLTPDDARMGDAFFTGRARFKSGAPSCNSCHTVRDLGGLGGGELGPDLTAAFARLDGRKPLSAWLSAPPGPVMQPVFRAHALEGDEILGLVAYLKDAAERGEPPAQPASLEFVVWSLGGAAVLLTLMDYAWRRRFTGVRKPLVGKDRS